MTLTFAQQSRLALAAALGTDRPDAFEQWQAGVDLDKLPPGHLLLLPLIYDNLEQSGREHPWLPRIRGVYRKMWYASQIALRSALNVVEAVQEQGQPALIAGAAALAHTVYPQPSLRPMLQPEIIVPQAGADIALRLLHSLGWQPRPAAPHLGSPAFRTWVAGQRFVNGRGQVLWLGWHVVPTLPCVELDAAFWAATTELTLDSRHSRTLCPADHLLRTCLTATDVGLIALVDTAWLLRQGTIDWQRLLAMTERFHAGWPVLHVLGQLAENGGPTAPPGIITLLRRLPASWADKQFLTRLLARPGEREAPLWQLLARYQRIVACNGNRLADPVHFVAFLQHALHQGSPWRLLQLVLRRMAGRL